MAKKNAAIFIGIIVVISILVITLILFSLPPTSPPEPSSPLPPEPTPPTTPSSPPEPTPPTSPPEKTYYRLQRCDVPDNLMYVFEANVSNIDPITGSVYRCIERNNGSVFIEIDFDISVYGTKVFSSGEFNSMNSCNNVITNYYPDGTTAPSNYIYKIVPSNEQEFDDWYNGLRN